MHYWLEPEFFNLRAFNTTLNELKDMAAAAAIGFRNPCSPNNGFRMVGISDCVNKGYKIPAAIGINKTL